MQEYHSAMLVKIKQHPSDAVLSQARPHDRHPPISRPVARVVLNQRLNFGPDAWITVLCSSIETAISIHSTDCFGRYRQDPGAPSLENQPSCICVERPGCRPDRTLELHT